MRTGAAATARVAASQVKRDWSGVINWAFSGEARFVVEKHGTPVAGIVSADDIEPLAALDARRAEGYEVLKRLSQAFHGQTVEEIEEAVAQAVAEVRGEVRCGAEDRPGVECFGSSPALSVMPSGLAGITFQTFTFPEGLTLAVGTAGPIAESAGVGGRASTWVYDTACADCGCVAAEA